MGLLFEAKNSVGTASEPFFLLLTLSHGCDGMKCLGGAVEITVETSGVLRCVFLLFDG